MASAAGVSGRSVSGLSFASLFASAAILGLACVAGCGSTPAAPPVAAAPRVTVRHPEVREIIDENEFNGWLQPWQTVEVRSRVRGHIKFIHFRDGDVVKKDDPLFDLDERPYDAALKETLAQVKALEAQKVAADKELERNRDLRTKGAIAAQELEKSEANALALAAQVAAKLQEGEKHKLDLEYTHITAPITGRISRALLSYGNLVNAGGSDPVLTTIVSQHPIYLYFHVDERALQRYQKLRREKHEVTGQETAREARIKFRFGREIDEGFPHEGWVEFAENRLDPATGTIQVRGVVRNEDGLFVPGSRARVRIPVSEPYQATLVPDQAVLSDQEKKYLLVLDEEGKVLRRDVTLGRLLDDGQRVIRGTPVGPKDWVLTLGLQRARVNYPVEAFDEAGKPIK